MSKQQPTYEQLVAELKAEGSLQEYYLYLMSRYGGETDGDLFSYTLEYPAQVGVASKEGNHFAKGFLDTSPNNYQTAQSRQICEDFLYSAMERDLMRKPLELIFAVAEAEKGFNQHPYLRAIDIAYLMKDINNTQEIADKVKEYETSFTEGED